jgi:GNAT superfamily N-acetyltransferase
MICASGGVVEDAGLQVEVWPTTGGTLVFPLLEGMAEDRARDAVLAQVAPGAAVVIGNRAVRDGLEVRGAQEVRHVLTMTRDVAPVAAAAVPGLVLRGWQDGDAESLAPALLGAYDADHPDPATPDLDAAARSVHDSANDPDNPRLRATTVAEIGGHPVGCALVLRCEHVTGWKGPWVMNVFRAPDPAVPGVGRAMLVRALDVLREDGESRLGLAVTASNPARRVYERLGFTYDFEGWVLVLPGGDAEAH